MIHNPASIESSLDLCIKCNICVTKCPVSAVTDLFPGPKYEGPQAGRFRQSFSSSPDISVDYCSGCRVCNLACPTGVKIAEINARARAQMVRSGKFSLQKRLRNNLIARTELIGKLGQPIYPNSNFLLSNKILRSLVEVALAIKTEAPLPPFSSQRFSRWLSHHNPSENLSGHVAYFHGCSTEFYEPRVGRAAIFVLEQNGYRVDVPAQNCCGLPLLSNGEFAAARKYHANNVKHLYPYAQQGIPIVGTSTSCTLTLKEEAPELLGCFDLESTSVARNVFDISEFLISLYTQGKLILPNKAVSLRVFYHAPCQYRAHRVGSPALDLIRFIPGLDITVGDADCCGIAGTYGYKTEKYGISMDVGNYLFSSIQEAKPNLVICDSETCRWQITHGTGLAVVHPIEMFAFACGCSPESPLVQVLEQKSILL
jgi:glycerol-3-phosphate dehydrogenase subunit C